MLSSLVILCVGLWTLNGLPREQKVLPSGTGGSASYWKKLQPKPPLQPNFREVPDGGNEVVLNQKIGGPDLPKNHPINRTEDLSLEVMRYRQTLDSQGNLRQASHSQEVAEEVRLLLGAGAAASATEHAQLISLKDAENSVSIQQEERSLVFVGE